MLQQKIFALGSAESSDYAYYTLELVVTEQAVDTDKNISTVDFVLQLRSGRYRFSQWGIIPKVILNGQEFEKEQMVCAIGYYSTLQLMTGEGIEVAHNEDGTLDMPVQFSIDMPPKEYYVPGDMDSGPLTMALTPISRGSGYLFTEGSWQKKKPIIGGKGHMGYVRSGGEWIKTGG